MIVAVIYLMCIISISINTQPENEGMFFYTLIARESGETIIFEKIDFESLSPYQ